MNISLRQLRAFLAVADLGSFTAASKFLNVTQSAVSGLVRDLEGELQVSLFHRTTRRVDLTQAGQEFHQSTGRFVVGLDRSAEDIRQLAARERGRLVIAVPPFLAATMLPPLVASFTKHYPGLSLVIQDIPTRDILDRISDGEIDVGLGTFPPELSGIERTTLLSDALKFFCAPTHPLAKASRLKWSQIISEPIIALPTGSGLRALIDISFTEAGQVLEPEFEVSQISTAIAMTEVGMGVCILPAYVQGSSERYKIASVPLLGPEVVREISLIRRSDRGPTPAAKAFIEFAQKEV